MDDANIISFEPLADPAIDPYDQHPNGEWSRSAWLPIIGPASWLVWGTVADRLRTDPNSCWVVEDLAIAHGLGTGTSPNSAIRRTLNRLRQFGIFPYDAEADLHLVRMTAPPLSPKRLWKLPAHITVAQEEAFPGLRRTG